MYHGNLELPAGQYEDGAQLPSGDADLIAMLHNEGVYQGRQIHLSATFAHDEARFTVRDEGPGFNACERMEIDRDPSRLTAAVGHGLVLIRMFMDNVTFNALGNEITMVKRRAEAPSRQREMGKRSKRRSERRREMTICSVTARGYSNFQFPPCGSSLLDLSPLAYSLDWTAGCSLASSTEESPERPGKLCHGGDAGLEQSAAFGQQPMLAACTPS